MQARQQLGEGGDHVLGGVPLRAADPLEFFAGLGVELGDALAERGGQVVAADDLPAGDQAQQQRGALGAE